MGVRGSLPDDDDFEKKLLTAGLKVTVEQESSPWVHAEVKILKYLENQGLARRMIKNIGVNKLCCPGCCALLGAKENPKILVHGQHQKWYPWPFSCSLSQDFPTLEQVLTTRKEVITNFMEDWSEHRRRKRSITLGTHSDSSGLHNFASWAKEIETVKKSNQGKASCAHTKAFIIVLKLASQLIFAFAIELTPSVRSLNRPTTLVSVCGMYARSSYLFLKLIPVLLSYANLPRWQFVGTSLLGLPLPSRAFSFEINLLTTASASNHRSYEDSSTPKSSLALFAWISACTWWWASKVRLLYGRRLES